MGSKKGVFIDSDLNYWKIEIKEFISSFRIYIYLWNRKHKKSF
jgi:hypothetical protein